MRQTNRTFLIPFNNHHFQAIFKNDNVLLGKLLEIETPKCWTEFDAAQQAIHSLYEIYKSLGNHPEWGSYFIISREESKLIGTCGFKGKPDADNFVEIGYEINTDYQNKGLATEVAMSLTEFAFLHHVTGINAHTLPERNASVKVLENCGFSFKGEIIYPEDGVVWKWCLVKK